VTNSSNTGRVLVVTVGLSILLLLGCCGRLRKPEQQPEQETTVNDSLSTTTPKSDTQVTPRHTSTSTAIKTATPTSTAAATATQTRALTPTPTPRANVALWHRPEVETSEPFPGIYVLRPDGEKVGTLIEKSSEPNYYFGNPSASPNGLELAIAYRGEVILVSTRGQGARAVTAHQNPNLSYATLAWSPDSRWLAYHMENQKAECEAWAVDTETDMRHLVRACKDPEGAKWLEFCICSIYGWGSDSSIAASANHEQGEGVYLFDVYEQTWEWLHETTMKTRTTFSPDPR